MTFETLYVDFDSTVAKQISSLLINLSSPIHFGCTEPCDTCKEVIAALSKSQK